MDRESSEQRHMPDPYDQFVTENPEETERLEQLVNEGRALLEKGEAEQARIRFVKALAIFPLVPSALTNLAALALLNDNPEQAWHYLAQVLEHFPNDPAAHATAIRYWVKRGSRPRAYNHGRSALNGLKSLLQRADELRDPTLPDRARIILLSVLPSFEADDLIVRLHSLCHDRTWNSSALVTFGIAYFNRGDFETARNIWLHADHSGPAATYLFFLDLIDRGGIVPFRLDYELSARLPSLDELRRAFDADPRSSRNPLRLIQPRIVAREAAQGSAPRQEEMSTEESALIEALRYAVVQEIPGLAVLQGLHHIFRGTPEEAELALSILFFERWPYLPQLLPAIVDDEALSMRVRLNGVLYLLWTVGDEPAVEALRHLEKEQTDEVDDLLSSIIWMQVALVTNDGVLGQRSEARARRLASKIERTHHIEPWLFVLDELSQRLQHISAQSAQSTDETPPSHETGQEARVNKVIPFPSGRRAKGTSQSQEPE